MTISQDSCEPRKLPTQQRSLRTVATILEAAGQILNGSGDNFFSTTSVAERAGVSIGTVYQYFPHSSAILIAVGEQDRQATTAQLRDLLSECSFDTQYEQANQFVQLLIAYYSRHNRATTQSQLMHSVNRARIDHRFHIDVKSIFEEAVLKRGKPFAPSSNGLGSWVFAHALLGVIGSADAAQGRMLHEPELQEALSRMALALVPDGFAGRHDASLDQPSLGSAVALGAETQPS